MIVSRRLRRRQEKKTARLLFRVSYEEIEAIVFGIESCNDWADLLYKHGWRKAEFQREWENRRLPKGWSKFGWVP